MDHLDEEAPDFDVHNDAKNFASASGILAFLMFALTAFISLTPLLLYLLFIAPTITLPVLIASKSRPAKRVAGGALLGIPGAILLAWILGPGSR